MLPGRAGWKRCSSTSCRRCSRASRSLLSSHDREAVANLDAVAREVAAVHFQRTAVRFARRIAARRDAALLGIGAGTRLHLQDRDNTAGAIEERDVERDPRAV